MANRAHMKAREANKIRALNSMAVTFVRQRNLELLNDIDETIDALSEKREAFDILANEFEEGVERIKEAPGAIDPEGKICAMLEETRDQLGEIHRVWSAKCEVARNAPELHPEDGVVEAYCSAIDSVARLHNAFNAIAWAIGEHDADFDKVAPGGPYMNAKDLIAALES